MGASLLADGVMPVRLITRIVLHHTFLAAVAWKRAFKGDQLGRQVWLSIDLANTEHIFALADLPAAIREPGVLDLARRPISVRGVGNSLGLDVETVRRAVVRLLDDGLCERIGDGLVVRSTAYEREEVRAASRLALDVLSSLFRELERWGIIFPDHPAVIAERPWESGRAVGLAEQFFVLLFLQFILRFGIETQSGFGRNLTTPEVFLCAFSANHRPFLEDDAINARYATWETLPPAALREPISIRAIAKRLDMAVETTRRHVNRLVELGFLEPRGGGFVIPTDAMTRPEFIKAVGDINGALSMTLRRMDRLATALAAAH